MKSNNHKNNGLNENNSDKYQRIISVDVLRGLMLVIMTLNHLSGTDGIIQRITFQPLGYVSAAEGFIYLSGFVYGLVYTRTFWSRGYDSIKSKSVQRAGVIYFYHIFILLIVLLPVKIDIWNLKELNDFQEQPLKSLILFMLLLLQPENMSILPMYILFVLLGPIAIRAFEKGFEKQILFLSGVLWFVSQWNLFQYNNLDLSAYGLELGYFNILSWQFLFFIGCYFGNLKAKDRLDIPVRKDLIGLAVVGLIFMTIIKHSDHGNIFRSVYYHFSERSTLGIARILGFGVIAYLSYIISIKKQSILSSKWLSILGRNSLQVFAYSVVMGYYYLQFEPQVRQFSPWLEVCIHLFMALTLLIPAKLHMLSVKRIPYVKRLGV